MDPQVRGSQLKVAIYDQTSYKEAPSSPSGTLIVPTSYGVVPNQERLMDESLTDDRTRNKPAQGNKDLGGPIPMNMSAEGICKLLKHAIGSVISGRPVKPSTTGNVTGVEMVRAETGTPTGNGTLSFTATGTTLSWQANGDTAGTAVDVSAGGEFTLESGTADHALTVNVTAGSLPGSDVSDSDIAVVDAYQHDFSISDLPTAFLSERDHGGNLSGTGRFEQAIGCRISSMAVSVPQQGYATVTFNVLGSKFVQASSALDATPDDPGHKSFTSFSATIEEGGAAIGKVTTASFTLDNGLDTDTYVVPEDTADAGERAAAAEGFASISGEHSTLFNSLDLMNKATNDTESSLAVNFKRGDGYGTADNESIKWTIQNLVYQLTAPPTEGPAGVMLRSPFMGYKNGTELGLTVRVRNQMAEV